MFILLHLLTLARTSELRLICLPLHMSKAPHVGDNILLHCGRLTSHHSHQAREGEMSPSLFLLFGRRVMSLASEVAVEVQQLAHL